MNKLLLKTRKIRIGLSDYSLKNQWLFFCKKNENNLSSKLFLINSMRIIYLVSVFILLFSCKKGQSEFVIKGGVFDDTFSQPLSGVSVEVIKVAADSGDEELVTTVYTDESGAYSFKVQRDRFVSLKFNVKKEAYFIVEKTVGFDELTLKEDNEVNFNTTGKSWAKIHLIHDLNDGAKLSVVRTEGKSGCSECCPDGYQQFEGVVDTIFYCVNDANRVYEITYFKLNSSFSGAKNVVTPFKDTSEILLEY